MMPTTNSQAAALKEQFASAWRFLKSHALLDVPWYLVIGPPTAGKTQLIVRSHFDFIAAPHLNSAPQDESEDNHRCNWWFTQRMTFLDVPGHYLCQEDNVSEWELFLTALEPYLARKPLNGIILTLDIAALSLLNKTEQKKTIQPLRETLFLFSKRLTVSCPVYFLLSKVDGIVGFNEFFADLGKEEREQICGINLAQAPKADTSSLPRLFKNQFALLIQRLQDRVIWRLHHERNAAKRALITQFPLQLESFGSQLADVLYHLTDIIGLAEKLPLQGIYLVSSLQQGLPVDCLRKTSVQDLTLPDSLVTLPITQKQQTYFSRQLFQNIAANTTVLKHAWQGFSTQDKWRLSSYILAVTLITAGGLLMANNFNQRITRLNAAQTALTQYSVLAQQLPPQNVDLGQTLPALNILRQATQLIAQTPLAWFSAQARQLAPLANKTYQQSLTTYFLPDITHQLEHALSNSTDPDFNYGALKVYLMLGDPSHLDKPFIKNWFAHYWQQLFAQNLTLQQQLNAHLAALLAQPFSPPELNHALIDKTRNLLANSSAPQLMYAIVKSQAADEWMNPVNKTTEQIKAFNRLFQSNSNLINHLYTQQSFSDIYLTRLLNAGNSLLKGDWVLGAATHTAINSNDLPALIEQARILYLKDYAAHWQNLLNNSTLIPWQNWPQVQQALADILSRQSPLIRLIKTVNDNTNTQTLTANNVRGFTPQDLQLINTYLSSPFNRLNNFVANGGLAQAIMALKNLQDLLKPVMKDPVASKNAFSIAKQRFTASHADDPITALTHLAENAPAPLQNWLASMANNSGQLVLTSAAHYINQSWQQQIVPFYQANLLNRYPFVKTAAAEVSYADFRHFFSSNGLLNNFFTTYLAPFLDTSHAQWQWQRVDGQTLKLAGNVLPQLERAAIIRTMFFDANNELKIPFTLKALAFEPGLTRLAFKYGQENFTDRAEQTSAHTLSWPNPGKVESVTLTFTDNANKTFTTTINGAWAFFRLLDNSSLQPTGADTQHYQLIFDYNGNAARYQLTANKLINPFIAGIIEQFQCPMSLQ